MKSESQIIEYKENWKDEYLKWVCGFANAQGGTLYIGINDDKQIVGLGNSKQLMEDIPNKIVTTMGIVPDVNLFTEAGKNYIQIKVRPSNMPIAYKGKYHYRTGSTKQELKGVALQQFIMDKMGRTWDDIAVPDTSIDDLDRGAIDYFLQRAIEAGRYSNHETAASTEKVVQNLGLVEKNGNLKAAALLLFTSNPSQYFPGVEFKIGRFHTAESSLIIQDVIEGNILQMADKVMRTLKSMYLVSPIHYEGLQRIEELEIPEEALREVIYNAIVHKDYTGSPIQMRVYDNHIEIWNDGLLPDSLTTQQLFQQHSSHPRNKNIANAFFKAGFIESWGSGYEKITEGLQRAGLPMPIVQEVEGGVKVSIKRRSLNEIIKVLDSKISTKGVANVSNDVTNNVTNKDTSKFTKRQKLICEIIKDNPHITANEMSATLSVTSRTIYRDLAKLQKENIVRHEGNTNAGIWVILE